LIFTIGSLIFTDIFFNKILPTTHIFGSILIFVSVMLYFFKIFQSDKILSIHKEFPFYVAIGAMVFHLIVTPLFIYNEYYSKKNMEFVEVRNLILFSANIFLYTCYILGFIICFRKSKSY